MKEIKKGYRLTTEEQAMIQNEITAAENERSETGGEQNPPKKPSKKALKTILPLAVMLVLMIVIAKVFMNLIGGEKNPEALTSDKFYFTLQQEAVHIQFPPLSDEEQALFMEKLALTPQEESIFWPEFYVFANLYEQADSVHRKWIGLMVQNNEKLTDPGQVLKLYLSENKKHKYLTERYSGIFSTQLSSERMPWVFILHDRIRQARNSENP